MQKFIFYLVFLICISKNAKAQVLINEYSCANLTTIIDDFQKHEDWVELYNNADVSVDISGYHLSDNPDEPTKWKIPQGATLSPKGFLIFWCDGRDSTRKIGNIRHFHSNFKFTQTKKKAETIIFSDANGKKIDEIKISKTRADQSRGRQTDGSADWVIFTLPTPKKANDGSYFTSNAERPEFSVKAGFYTVPQVVTITSKEPNTTIYFTLNGSEPTSNSTKYTAPLTLDKTTVLKAIVVSNDPQVQSSLTEFSTFFINDKHSLNVVSISSSADLDSLASGNKDLVPFGAFEFFDEKGERQASTFGEFNSHGQDSWVNGQRSLDFISRDECGYSNAIKHQLFPITERDEFQRIILRAAGDDNYPDGSGTPGGGAHMRDSYIQNLAKKGKLNLDVRTGEKAIIYLNGKYWGVYDLRERPDDHDFTDFYYGQGKFDLQFIQTWGQTWAEYGGNIALNDWKKLATYAEKNDLKNPVHYKYVTDQLDVTSLADYIITNSLSVCSDWINYNTGWWRGKNPNGKHQKWGFHLWDNDATFGYYQNYTGIPDTAANKAEPCHVELLSDSVTIVQPAYIAEDTITFLGQIFYPGDTIFPGGIFRDFVDLNKHMKIFNRLRENPEFNQYYITRYADLMQTVFSQQNMLAYFDEIYNKIKPEMPRHIQRWGGTMAGWEKNAARLRHYILRRTDYLNDGLKDCYKLAGPYEVTFDIAGTTTAKLNINSQIIEKFPYKTQLFGNIDTKVVANSGSVDFQFDNWSATQNAQITQNKVNSTTILIKNNETITATFVKATIAAGDKPNSLDFNVSAFPTVFESYLNITYNLPQSSDVKVQLSDINGRQIAIHNDFSNTQSEGNYTMHLDMSNANLATGIYFVAFQTGQYKKVIKVIKNN